MRRAFTLIELLVVMSIIAILVGALLPAVSMGNDRAMRAHCKANLERIGMAVRLFVEDKGRFPKSLEELMRGNYLDDPDCLKCPKTGRPYWYRPPRSLYDGRAIIASCVPPDTPEGRRPHGFGEVTLTLRASGRVEELRQ
ncbi:MAG TPA: prepilin-type N-terminal cleavage/methylation domain-containing protein [Armatimonadetes bacterium]|nr:prepilin-type N-terminal cleavage/methylation domain-containing protein [Armatimonadota bacterium]